MILKELSESKDKKIFCIKNKREILKAKKDIPLVKGAPVPSYINSKSTATKADSGSRLVVEVIANLTNFMDSHNDVLLPGAYTKSINDNGTFPFLKDHNHSSEGIVALTEAVFTKQISAKELGYPSSMVKNVEALVFRAEPKANWDRKVYELYKDGGINQHSIGLKYVIIELAVNDPEDTEGFALWNKYIDQVINKEEVEEEGFFFPVREIKIFENSAVLFGANKLTPTLSVESQKSQPLKSTTGNKSFYHLILNQ